MSGSHNGYSYRYVPYNAQTYAHHATTSTNLVNKTHFKNQINGVRVVGTTSQKPKVTTTRSPHLPIQQEKRPLRQQIATRPQMNPTVVHEEFSKINKEARETLRIQQDCFQRCIKAILNNQQYSAINDSDLSQGIRKFLNVLRKTVLDLQKDKSELQQMKKYIKYVENTPNLIVIDPLNEWKRILARSINDRKAIQECVIGNPIQVQRINSYDYTEKGVNILRKLSKFPKNRQLEQRMRTQWLTLAKQKSGNTHFSMSNHNILQQSIDKVYESIKQHLASSLQEELAQQKKKVEELSRQLESARKTRPSNASTAVDKHLNLLQELAQVRKAKDVLQDSKNEQIHQLKSEILRLQQEMKDAEHKKGSNSRIQFKETSNRQFQHTIRQKQAGLNSQHQTIAKLNRENESLRQEISNLNEQLKKTKEQSSSVELALKLNIRDYQKQLKTSEAYIFKLTDEKNSLMESAKQMQATLGQKQSQIVKLNAAIVQKDRQINLMKSNQKQRNEQYDRILKEKRTLQDSLKYQRQRESAQRKNGDASRQQIIRQRDDLQSNLDKLQEQNRQLATSNQSLQLELKQLKNKLENLQLPARNQLSNSQLRQNSTEIINLQNLLKSKDKQIADLKSFSNSRSSNQGAVEGQMKKIRSENFQQKQEIKILNLNLSSKTKQLQQKKTEYKIIEQKMRQAELNLKQSESKITALQKEKAQLNSVISRHERNIKAKDEEIKQLVHTNDNLHQMMSEMNDLKINSSFAVEEKPHISSSRVIQLQNQTHRLAEQIKQSKNIQKQLEGELKTKETRITELLSQQQRREGDRSRTLQSIQYQNSQLKNRMREMQQLSRVNVDDQARINALYQHELLNDYYQYKLFLTETLEEHYNLRIKRTRLIFNYDLLNKVNFHQYIDNISSILLIIKTAAGMFIAGYSEGPFLRRSSDRDGLILSLTNRKYFTLLQPNRRAITYDEYYIIFGNSQIRLKSLENRVFSNFGISNGYYNSRGEKVTVLLGGGQHDREMEIESYEIYQVLFDDY